MQACKAHPGRRAHPAGAARAAAPRRAALQVRAIQAGAHDHTARVRGNAQLVSWYCSDVASWPEWSPITKRAVKLGLASELVAPGSKFELRQEIWGVAYPMIYEVLEFEPGKRLVLSGVSEHHTETSQFIFMPDRHDHNMTIVRYVSDAQLRQWRSALQPLVSGLLKRVPEQSLAALQSLLNGPRSPLFRPDAMDAWRRHAAAAASARKGRPAAAPGAGARRAKAAGAHAGAGGGGFPWASLSFDGLLGGVKARGGAAGGASGDSLDADDWAAAAAAADAAAAAAAAPGAAVDPAGHYAALGLRPAAAAADVRAAYRRRALELHPDRQSAKAPRARARAAEEFARVLRAYEALKDPQARALYDAGLIVEQTAQL